MLPRSASLPLRMIAFMLIDFDKLFLDNMELISVWSFGQYNFRLLDIFLPLPMLSKGTLNPGSEGGSWGMDM